MDDSGVNLIQDSLPSRVDSEMPSTENGTSDETPDESFGMQSTLSMMRVEMERMALQIDVMESYVKEMHDTFKKMEPMLKKYSEKPRFRIKGD
jgi:hypothetical protein